MPLDSEFCSNCEFFFDQPDSSTGWCLRNPPTAAGPVLTEWDQWCGEWVLREDGAPVRRRQLESRRKALAKGLSQQQHSGSEQASRKTLNGDFHGAPRGQRIDANRATAEDWRRLDGIQDSQVDLLMRLQQGGVLLSGMEDLMRLLELNQQQADAWKPLLVFR